MKFLVCRSNSPLSLGVQFRTAGRWSHVAIVHNNGVDAIEAVYPHVRRTTVAAIRAAHSETILREIPTPNDMAGWAWALSTIGDDYDWGALFGILLDRDWTEEGRWFCAEHLAMAFEEAGAPQVEPGYTHFVYPQFWAMVRAPFPLAA